MIDYSGFDENAEKSDIEAILAQRETELLADVHSEREAKPAAFVEKSYMAMTNLDDGPQYDLQRRPKPKPRFTLRMAGSLEVKAPQWLAHNLFETDSLAEIHGDPGVAKTFFSIDLAACIATGTPFHGRKVRQGLVIYIADEGHNGFARRIKAWEIRYQCSLVGAPFYVSGGAAQIGNPGSVSDVIESVDTIATEHGQPALIVIDTVARNFGPGDENSTQDMSRFVVGLDSMRAKYRATVLANHHTGHSDKNRARGAMALRGALDAEYRLEKDNLGVVRLLATKMKDAPVPAPMAFRLCTVELGITDDEGAPVTSAVLDDVDYEQPAKTSKGGSGKWQALALEIADNLLKQHKANREAAGNKPEYARVSVVEWHQECCKQNMPRQRFSDVRKSLEVQGLLLIENEQISGVVAGL